MFWSKTNKICPHKKHGFLWVPYSHTLSAPSLQGPAKTDRHPCGSTCSIASCTCKLNRRWKTFLRWESTVARKPRFWNLREALSEPSYRWAVLGLGGTGPVARYTHSRSCDRRELRRGSRTSAREDRVQSYAEIVVKFLGLGTHKFSGSEAESRKAWIVANPSKSISSCFALFNISRAQSCWDRIGLLFCFC
jgi:hypothetical protein